MSLQYILDGYNIINQVNFPRTGLPDERLKLIRFIEKFRPQGSRSNKVIIVFDGHKNVFSYPGRPELKIVFSGAESADEWIKGYIERVSRPRECIVITDDKEIKFFVRAVGAKVVPVQEFINKAKKKIKPVKEEKKTLPYDKAYKITRELEKIWLEEEN